MTQARLLQAELFQMICPCLHHLGARLQIERVVVSRAGVVTFLMAQLKLDVLMREALLVKNRGATPRNPCPVIRLRYPIRYSANSSVLLLIGFCGFTSPGNTNSRLNEISFSFSRTSIACVLQRDDVRRFHLHSFGPGYPNVRFRS